MNPYWYLAICLLVIVVAIYALAIYICKIAEDDVPEGERKEKPQRKQYEMDPLLASEILSATPQFGGLGGYS
jgi:hypothetical protein